MFTPDGQHVLGIASNKLVILPIARPQEMLEFATPSVSIGHAAFSRDGNRVITSSNNGAQLWNLGAGRGNPVILAAGTPIKAATFSPDGKRVLTVTEEGTISYWDIDEELLSQRLQQASTVCLSTHQRMRYLNESEHEALSRCEACEKEYGRPRESCAFE
jgi:WD40 repeat protein